MNKGRTFADRKTNANADSVHGVTAAGNAPRATLVRHHCFTTARYHCVRQLLHRRKTVLHHCFTLVRQRDTLVRQCDTTASSLDGLGRATPPRG